MAAAEVIDALRIFPRGLVVAYGWLVGYETIMATWWYFHLPAVERSLEVTAFFSMLMGGLFGLAAYVFKTYTEGGYDWQKYREFHANIPFQNISDSGPSRPAG